jgi:hypothetical protein
MDVINDPFNPGGGLCGDSGIYVDLKQKICAAIDIVADPKQDNTLAPCDALSMTALFTAGPAQLGNLLARKPPDRPCGPSWTDDCP